MAIEKMPQNFVMRPASMDDIEEVTQLIRLCEIEHSGKAEMTQEDMRTFWQTPGFDVAQDAWVVCTPAAHVIGVGFLMHKQHSQFRSEVDVHPDYTGKGVGTRLSEYIEERARQLAVEADPEARITIAGQVTERHKKAGAFFLEHGFTFIRQSWHMQIKMQEPPPKAIWATGIAVKTMEPGMEYQVYMAEEDAFKDHWGHMPRSYETWAHWSIKREGFDPSLWFLAMDGDEVAGISLCRDEKEQGGWVHVLGVRRQWRRKGLGQALLYHSFAEFYRRGIYEINLGVDAQSLTGATRLYERAGMRAVEIYHTYEKELRAGKELSTQILEL